MSYSASYRPYLLLLVALLCLSGGLWSQRVSIQTRLDRPEIRIGEQASVDMTIRTDDLERTRFHLVEDSTGVARFRILAFAATDTVDLGDGLKEIQAKMIVTSFDSTLITLPPILVETPSGQALSKPLALNVISPKVDISQPDKIEPIVSPWEVRITLADLLELLQRFLWIAVALAALIVGLLYIRQRRKQQSPQAATIPLPEIKLTALDELEQALRQLQAHPLAVQEDFKTYFTDLITALRSFFKTIYGVETAEKTSEELLEILQERGASRTTRLQTEEILQLADGVKFAKSLPSRQEAEGHCQRALELARQEYTRLQEQATTQAVQSTQQMTDRKEVQA